VSELPVFASDGVRAVRTDVFADELVASAAVARERLWLSMFLAGLTVADLDGEVRRVLREVVLARARGVDVRVLVDDFTVGPEVGRPNSPAAEWLTRRAVAVRTSGVGRRRSVHAKYVLVDEASALVGSGNLTPGALASNAELGILVHSRPLVRSLASSFEREWARARPWAGAADVARAVEEGA